MDGTVCLRQTRVFRRTSAPNPDSRCCRASGLGILRNARGAADSAAGRLGQWAGLNRMSLFPFVGNFRLACCLPLMRVDKPAFLITIRYSSIPMHCDVLLRGKTFEAPGRMDNVRKPLDWNQPAYDPQRCRRHGCRTRGSHLLRPQVLRRRVQAPHRHHSGVRVRYLLARAGPGLRSRCRHGVQRISLRTARDRGDGRRLGGRNHGRLRSPARRDVQEDCRFSRDLHLRRRLRTVHDLWRTRCQVADGSGGAQDRGDLRNQFRFLPRRRAGRQWPEGYAIDAGEHGADRRSRRH